MKNNILVTINTMPSLDRANGKLRKKRKRREQGKIVVSNFEGAHSSTNDVNMANFIPRKQEDKGSKRTKSER
jgi:hypothetical protein